MTPTSNQSAFLPWQSSTCYKKMSNPSDFKVQAAALERLTDISLDEIIIPSAITKETKLAWTAQSLISVSSENPVPK